MNSIYKLAKSVLFRFTPEQAHHIILSNLDWATQLGAQKLVTRSFPENPIEIMGLRFPNCVGLAAGMDKDGEHVTAFGALGFGSVEIGTVTPKGQPGNPKPRLFRLIPDEAIINRMGFNNVGAIQVAKNLQSARAFRNRGGILGINIGKNKVTPNSEALSDYKKCMDRLYTSGDYIAINISSPIGANKLLFLPYMLGERTPRWNVDAKGAFIGLTLGHQHGDMLRAVMEGITLNLGFIVNIFRQHVPIDQMTVIGGCAQNPVWRQMMADIYQAEIRVPNYLEEATSMGAAILAGIGAGVFKDFSVIDRFVRIEQTVQPIPENRAKYEAWMPVFDKAYHALYDMYTEIAKTELDSI